MHTTTIFWLIALSSLQIMTSFSMEGPTEPTADLQYRQVQKAIKNWDIDKVDRIMQSSHNVLTNEQRQGLKQFAVSRNSMVAKFDYETYIAISLPKVLRGFFISGIASIVAISGYEKSDSRLFLGSGLTLFGFWDMYNNARKSIYSGFITKRRKEISELLAKYDFFKKS